MDKFSLRQPWKERQASFVQLRGYVLGFGANTEGYWGVPKESIENALRLLQSEGCRLKSRSDVYVTKPMGHLRQPSFVNCVCVFDADKAPGSMLRLLKQLERGAGRRRGVLWGPRPLDIDILASGGRVVGKPGRATGKPWRRVTGHIILPHPELEKRGFVLVPFADVAPFWRHPVSGLRVGDLLRRAPALRRGVRRIEPRVG